MLKNMDPDYAQKMQRCHEYVEALEDERKKIQVFQRELPLCLELVTQAIEACRRELSCTTSEYVHGQSECSEQTTSECGGPVFEEFIPIKRSSSCEEDDEHESREPENDGAEKRSQNTENNMDKKKSDWLRSVQLWNQSPDPQPKYDHAAKKATVVEVKRNGGAFQPFHKEKPITKSTEQPVKVTSLAPAVSSTAEIGGGKLESSKEEEQQTEQQPTQMQSQSQSQSQRKQRRCWSPELHRRFLHALQQLGGSHVATPKQIRELMKVDGLTNDEVKSHLQKYRLHTRRPTPPAAHGGGNPPHQPQFVVVGGIWVPPASEYVPAADASKAVYAPVATAPVPPPPARSTASPKRSEERSSGRCNSPATSSSTHTATTSPVA